MPQRLKADNKSGAGWISATIIGVVFGSALFGQGRPAGPAIATGLDISGVWNFATITRRERPARFATRPFLTREEAAALEEEILRTGTQRLGSGTVFDESVLSERGHMAIVNGRYLSSLVTDPADGRIPALTQAAKARDVIAILNDLDEVRIGTREDGRSRSASETSLAKRSVFRTAASSKGRGAIRPARVIQEPIIASSWRLASRSHQRQCRHNRFGDSDALVGWQPKIIAMSMGAISIP